MGQDQPLEALHDDRSECNRAEVIQTCSRRVLRYRHDGRGFKAHRNDCLGQGQVENVREDPSQLYSTRPKDPSRDSIRPSSLSCICPAQYRLHISGGKYEGLMVCREDSFSGCLCVLPIETSIKCTGCPRCLTVTTLSRRGPVRGNR